MLPKKMLFPVGGGDELEARIYGALLVSKYFSTHLEIQVAESNVHSGMPKGMVLPNEIIDRLKKIQLENIRKIMSIHKNIFDSSCKKLDIIDSEMPIENQATAHLTMGVGLRSIMVAQQTKFCDVVIAAAPQKGVTTATFEAAVLESGKPVIVIPRALKEFKPDEIIIGWNNSPEVARAVSEAIPLMKKAKKVQIVSTKAYTTETLSRIKDLRNYLAMHGIETTFELIKSTFIPGESLLKTAQKGNFNFIVAGAYSKKGLKEIMLGGSSRYLLEHTTIPALVSH
ncbi:MAG: universal stress protein [Sulfurospirillum sp.]|nr:universal stress protein [Sulfurospirillum sp.]MBL0703196.1 universal stress protein [Sulfurospirillum sp.]